ncbi:hypothetical protein PFISCL1PPCAC_14757, partial [Pristionchus fissidentatus]
MTINRLAVFCIPRMNCVFTLKNTKWTLLVTWIVILAMTTFSILLSPIRKFNKETLNYDEDEEAIINDAVLYQISESIDYCIPFLIISFYIVIYIAIKRQRRVARVESAGSMRSKEDRRLLIQAFIITFLLELCNLMKLTGSYDYDESTGW